MRNLKVKDLTLNRVSEDDRGQIYTIEGLKGIEEVTIFITKSNKARGGCIHHINDETCTVLSGRVIFVLGDKVKLVKKGESISIPKSTPHYFFSNTDSVVMEWGATYKEKIEKHKEFRAIVEIINDRTNKTSI